MGYYTGTGDIVGGGEEINQFGSLVYNGAHIVYQKTISTVTRKPGVSLSVAQNAHSSCTLRTSVFQFANLYPFVGCRGRKTVAAYTKISDSNLYDLTVTASEMHAKADEGNWIGPDET